MNDCVPYNETTLKVVPFSLKDAPALIERLLPVQKLSAEVFKERTAGSGQILTSLGSYWKGRKPLILAKACVLGCLLPATDNPEKDLEIFEMLMGMDDASMVARWKKTFKLQEMLQKATLARIRDYFIVKPEDVLPQSSPIPADHPGWKKAKIKWREDVSLHERRNIMACILPNTSYREKLECAYRPEEVDDVHDHIWDAVNKHLGTDAHSFPELVEQLGIMRFGTRPVVADPFCGSGQIPFEAARLGCDVYASDLNPVACMLTWGAFHIVGATADERDAMQHTQKELIKKVQEEIDKLGIETDGNGWRAKVFLYCVEVRCPQTGWMVPLLPSLVISTSNRVIAKLVPNPNEKRYEIEILSGVSEEKLKEAERGTVRSDTRGGESYMVHTVDDKEYRTKISTLRGDYTTEDGRTANRLRLWEKHDFMPRPDDIFQERLYCIQWMRPVKGKNRFEYEFRSVTDKDLAREKIVQNYVATHLAKWQEKGYVPDMRIEPGDETERLYRERGWTHWHHLFNPRQLIIGNLIKKYSNEYGYINFSYTLNYLSKLCIWDRASAKGQNAFYNQALNTIFNYTCRAFVSIKDFLIPKILNCSLITKNKIENINIDDYNYPAHIFITDPPYGDAVKYEEILEFFIAWLRKNPPGEFSRWIWDSRRALAIKGEDEEFRRKMVSAYTRMTESMSDIGIQVIMFTHQSGKIWADLAHIVWASGLQVTAAWYVVTETESALREGAYVRGTVLLVCRKRMGEYKTTSNDLAWEIQEEVKQQVDMLTGLNQSARGIYRDENVFEDADIQMAGYAAALRVLTKYARIDGRDMAAEAVRPRQNGQSSFVEELIAFAVNTANQCLVPKGIDSKLWEKLAPAERFYLKMLELESRGAKSLDNYQNFAKAFKVQNFYALMGSRRANNARLKSATEFGKTEMNEGSELYNTVLRAVLYAIMELRNDVDGNEVLAHLTHNVPSYYENREGIILIADYLATHTAHIRPDESRASRILCELVKNQKLGS